MKKRLPDSLKAQLGVVLPEIARLAGPLDARTTKGGLLIVEKPPLIVLAGDSKTVRAVADHVRAWGV